MCVANLNVTLQPCSHRWYTLRQPCQPCHNLSNCPQKLRLEGWETRNESCPWCSSTSTSLDESTHRLFGGSVSSTSSPRDRRASSATNSTSSLSRSNSSARGYAEDDEESTMSRGERARMMNYRLDLYMTTNPEWKAAAQSKRDEDDSDSQQDSDSPSQQPVARRGSVIGKGWKKGVRLSRGMFKG